VGESQAPQSPGSDATSKQASASDKPPAATAPEHQEPDNSTGTTDDEPTPARTRPERASQAQAAVTPPGSATKPGFQQSVQFLTEPPGAQVVIDGNSAATCKTPCVLPLSAGRHALTVQLTGYRPYPRVFNVPQDSDVFLQLAKVTGTLNVTSEPVGATIDLDGALQSNRTPAIFNLVPGTYHIKVARGGESLDFEVQLRDGDVVTKKVTFPGQH
jgi:hypothetical protein